MVGDINSLNLLVCNCNADWSIGRGVAYEIFSIPLFNIQPSVKKIDSFFQMLSDDNHKRHFKG